MQDFVRRAFLRTACASLAFASAAVAAGCSPADLLNATVSTRGVTVTRDLAYGEGPRRRLDVYRPNDGAVVQGAASGAGRGRPVAVFIYGGNWRTGAKEIYPFVAQALAHRGILTVVPDYRLYPEVQFPGFVEDCAQAVAWTLRHAAEYGGDPRRVTVIGHSAGAFNAAMLAVDPAFLEAAGTSRDKLAGVAGLAGPYDFLPIRDPDVIAVFASVDAGPASQPITYVDGRNPPMLLLAGDEDQTVNPRNTVSLGARIVQAGGTAEIKIYPGLGHIGIITAVAGLFRRRAPVLDDLVAFVETALPR